MRPRREGARFVVTATQGRHALPGFRDEMSPQIGTQSMPSSFLIFLKV